MVLKLQVIWLMLMMLFPAKLSLIKYGILAVILFLNMSNRELRQNIPVKLLSGVILFLMVSVTGLYTSMHFGYAVGFKHIDIYILRPLYVLIFINNIRTEHHIQYLIKGIVNIILVISIYDFIYCLGEFHIIPQMIFWENSDTSVTIIGNGFLTCRLVNVTSLLFGLPVIYSLFFSGQGFQYANKKKLLFTMVLGTAIGMISGRRVLQVVILASLCGCILLKLIKNRGKIKKSAIFTIIAVIILIVAGTAVLQYKLGIDNLFNTIALTIKDAFVSAVSDDSPRKLQVKVLFDSLIQYPVFGVGLSSFINGRDVLEYEYQYLAYLAEVGIAGIAVYVLILTGLSAVLWRGAKCRKYKAVNHCYSAILYGAFWFFVAASTNPMIVSTWFWIPILAFFQVRYRLDRQMKQQTPDSGSGRMTCRQRSYGFR